jgi:hypothetical protein
LEDLECTSTIGQDEKHQRRNLIHHIKANKLFLPIDQSCVSPQLYFFIGNGGMGGERERERELSPPLIALELQKHYSSIT